MPPIKHSHRRSIGVVGAAGILLGVAWVAGLLVFVASIPEEPSRQQPITDAIVVLTGGSGRLDQGLNLLADKRAEKLFVSGVYRGVDVVKLLEISRRLPDDFLCCVSLGYAANSTSGNAQETADWIRSNNFTSIGLVTANYHMPRSLLEFHRVMPEIEIAAHPVFPESFKLQKWWTWPGSTALIISEYSKFLLAWLRHTAVDMLAKFTS